MTASLLQLRRRVGAPEPGAHAQAQGSCLTLALAFAHPRTRPRRGEWAKARARGRQSSELSWGWTWSLTRHRELGAHSATLPRESSTRGLTPGTRFARSRCRAPTNGCAIKIMIRAQACRIKIHTNAAEHPPKPGRSPGQSAACPPLHQLRPRARAPKPGRIGIPCSDFRSRHFRSSLNPAHSGGVRSKGGPDPPRRRHPTHATSHPTKEPTSQSENLNTNDQPIRKPEYRTINRSNNQTIRKPQDRLIERSKDQDWWSFSQAAWKS